MKGQETASVIYDLAGFKIYSSLGSFESFRYNMRIRKLKFFFRFSNTGTISFFEGQVIRFSTFGEKCASGIYPWTTFFFLYVNDLTGYLLNCKIHLYADDAQLCLNNTLDDISSVVDCLNGELVPDLLMGNC